MINKNNIDKIQFIFENCESVTVPSENISNFNIHINDKEMIKVYDDFVMVNKELFKDICLKANEKSLYSMINEQ